MENSPKTYLFLPSGILFCAYKSGLCQEILVTARNYTYQHPKYYPILTKMLEIKGNGMIKKPMNWRIDKLTIILFFKADFNFLNKKLGKNAL